MCFAWMRIRFSLINECHTRLLNDYWIEVIERTLSCPWKSSRFKHFRSTKTLYYISQAKYTSTHTHHRHWCFKIHQKWKRSNDVIAEKNERKIGKHCTNGTERFYAYNQQLMLLLLWKINRKFYFYM